MGLDMYLDKKIYLGRKNLKVVGIADNYPSDADRKMIGKEYKGVESVIIEVAYWRKAYAIHQWFCDTLDNVENCRDSYVDKDLLKELCDNCKKILDAQTMEDKLKLANELLPDPDDNYDEWYFADIKNTYEMLNGKIEDDCDYYYHPWW